MSRMEHALNNYNYNLDGSTFLLLRHASGTDDRSVRPRVIQAYRMTTARAPVSLLLEGHITEAALDNLPITLPRACPFRECHING